MGITKKDHDDLVEELKIEHIRSGSSVSFGMTYAELDRNKEKPVEYYCSQCGNRQTDHGYSHCSDHLFKYIVKNSTSDLIRTMIEDAYEYGYQMGHDDTVESCYSPPEGMGCDYFESALKDGTIK